MLKAKPEFIPKVIIDTNIFISSFFGGLPAQVIDLWKSGKIHIGLSQEIIEEYLRVLQRLKISESNIQKLTQLFAENHNASFAAKTPRLEIIKNDPDDNKFLECAVALDYKIIISGDKDLTELKKYIDIEIFYARDFLEKFFKA